MQYPVVPLTIALTVPLCGPVADHDRQPRRANGEQEHHAGAHSPPALPGSTRARSTARLRTAARTRARARTPTHSWTHARTHHTHIHHSHITVTSQSHHEPHTRHSGRYFLFFLFFLRLSFSENPFSLQNIILCNGGPMEKNRWRRRPAGCARLLVHVFV